MPAMSMTPDATAPFPCAHCRYDLRGLDPASECPECGQPIVKTVDFDLRRAAPDWIRRQSRAMLWVAPLVVAQLRPFADYPGGALLSFGIALTCGVVAAFGCWQLATPEPPAHIDDPMGSAQRALRLFPLAHLGLTVFSLAYAAFGRAVATIVALASVASFLVTVSLVLFLVHRLARRTLDPALAGHARVALWAYPLTQIALVALPSATVVVSTGPAVYWVWSAMSWACALATGVMLILLGRMHESLKHLARAAESPPRDAAGTSAGEGA